VRRENSYEDDEWFRLLDSDDKIFAPKAKQ